jgi:hypothetical protein
MDATSGWSSIFFFAVILIGQYVIFNLFLAILLSGFADAGFAITGKSGDDLEDGAGIDLLDRLGRWLGALQSNAVHPSVASFSARYRKKSSVALAVGEVGDLVKQRSRHSLLCFSDNSLMRRVSKRIVDSRLFEWFILGCIIMSSSLVAVQQPQWKDDHPANFPLRVCDAVFAAVFTLEMSLKCIAHGFLHGPQAYLRDGWNWIDIFVVFVSILALSFDSIKSLRTIRTFRAIRPLRIIKRFAGMRLVVNCLLRSIPSMIQVISVVLLFFLIFAILGTNLFKGAYHFCSSGAVNDNQYEVVHATNDTASAQPILNWKQCVDAGYTWQQREYSFDNVLAGLLTLFEVATLEGWPWIMNAGLDAAVRPGLASKPMQNPNYAWFFVAFIIVGTFFAVNLFTGIVIQNYNVTKRLSERDDGLLHELNEAQKRWIQTVTLAMRTKPQRCYPFPHGSSRPLVIFLCSHKCFEYSIVFCVVLNIGILAADHAPATEILFHDFSEMINLAFTGIFVTELSLKLFAFSPAAYWQDDWNKFDSVVVLISAIDSTIVLVSILGVSSADRSNTALAGFGTLKILRIFRVSRVFRLLKSAKNLRRLLATLAFALPSLLNIFCLILVIIVVYAILGQQFFWNVQPVAWLDEYAHFRTFFSAFLLLIRCWRRLGMQPRRVRTRGMSDCLCRVATGENWNGIMHDCRHGLCRECDSAAGALDHVSPAMPSTLMT